MAGLLPIVGAYLALGAVIALPFAVFVGRLEPSAVGGSIGFRLLLLPGATILWPLVLVRALRRATPATARVSGHVRAHRLVFVLFAILFAATLAHALHRRAIHHASTAEAP